MKLARTVLCSAFRNVYGRDLKKKKKKKKEKIIGSGKKRKSAETRKIFMSVINMTLAYGRHFHGITQRP